MWSRAETKSKQGHDNCITQKGMLKLGRQGRQGEAAETAAKTMWFLHWRKPQRQAAGRAPPWELATAQARCTAAEASLSSSQDRSQWLSLATSFLREAAMDLSSIDTAIPEVKPHAFTQCMYLQLF